MRSSVTVRHNFETAHRLPPLEGKCQNIHGHSWWAEITVVGPRDDVGVVIDFGALKAKLRKWIDEQLDHGAMLGYDDSLRLALEDDGCKVFVFREREWPTKGLKWPTVENVSIVLARVTEQILMEMGRNRDCQVQSVHVQETHVNGAGCRV